MLRENDGFKNYDREMDAIGKAEYDKLLEEKKK